MNRGAGTAVPCPYRGVMKRVKGEEAGEAWRAQSRVAVLQDGLCDDKSSRLSERCMVSACFVRHQTGFKATAHKEDRL